jgi:hypothetical protein
MIDFVDELELELREATARRVRLETARIPRPSATVLTIGIPLLVTAAVLFVALQLSPAIKHSTSEATPASSSPLTSTRGPRRLPAALTHSVSMFRGVAVNQARYVDVTIGGSQLGVAGGLQLGLMAGDGRVCLMMRPLQPTWHKHVRLRAALWAACKLEWRSRE